jgi:hypothetical protein
MRQRVLSAVAVGMRARNVREDQGKRIAVGPDGGWVEQHLFVLLLDSRILENLVDQAVSVASAAL